MLERRTRILISRGGALDGQGGSGRSSIGKEEEDWDGEGMRSDGIATVLVVGAGSFMRQPLLTKEIEGDDVLLGRENGEFSFSSRGIFINTHYGLGWSRLYVVYLCNPNAEELGALRLINPNVLDITIQVLGYVYDTEVPHGDDGLGLAVFTLNERLGCGIELVLTSGYTGFT